MTSNEPIRRDVLQALAAAPFMALLAPASEAGAQVGVSPVRVDTKGLVAKIKFEAPLTKRTHRWCTCSSKYCRLT
jgi:hypothetical protein